MRGWLDSFARTLGERWNPPRPHPDPIFVLGNQKSGTTAIAALLASGGELSRTLDLPRFSADEQHALHAGALGIHVFVATHAREFSSELVKEPALTFLYPKLREVFPCRRAVFVVRDPRENLRSVLDRVDLPGDLDSTPPLDRFPPLWQMIVDNRWLGITAEHYIDSLAERWNLAVDVWRRQPERFVLARYEDFVADKQAWIERLAAKLGVPVLHDVGDEVDLPFQRPGNAQVSWDDFFGARNLARISERCAGRMNELGYDPAASSRAAGIRTGVTP